VTPTSFFFVAISVVILSVTAVPMLLLRNDRRREPESPPLSRALRILGRTTLLSVTLVVILGVAAMVWMDAYVADQERACKARGGEDYSLMDGCW
jgi:predicted MFS family arabinose efflux permease